MLPTVLALDSCDSQLKEAYKQKSAVNDPYGHRTARINLEIDRGLQVNRMIVVARQHESSRAVLGFDEIFPDMTAMRELFQPVN
jgi:hypothetical protein